MLVFFRCWQSRAAAVSDSTGAAAGDGFLHMTDNKCSICCRRLCFPLITLIRRLTKLSCLCQSEHFICSSASSVCRAAADVDVKSQNMSPDVCVLWSLSKLTSTRRTPPSFTISLCVTVCVCVCLTWWSINTRSHSPV